MDFIYTSMKSVAFGFSRLLARSISLLMVTTLITGWLPIGFAEKEETAPALQSAPEVDRELERLWNQSIDDPTPQKRLKSPVSSSSADLQGSGNQAMEKPKASVAPSGSVRTQLDNQTRIKSQSVSPPATIPSKAAKVSPSAPALPAKVNSAEASVKIKPEQSIVAPETKKAKPEPLKKNTAFPKDSPAMPSAAESSATVNARSQTESTVGPVPPTVNEKKVSKPKKVKKSTQKIKEKPAKAESAEIKASEPREALQESEKSQQKVQKTRLAMPEVKPETKLKSNSEPALSSKLKDSQTSTAAGAPTEEKTPAGKPENMATRKEKQVPKERESKPRKTKKRASKDWAPMVETNAQAIQVQPAPSASKPAQNERPSGTGLGTLPQQTGQAPEVIKPVPPPKVETEPVKERSAESRKKKSKPVKAELSAVQTETTKIEQKTSENKKPVETEPVKERSAESRKKKSKPVKAEPSAVQTETTKLEQKTPENKKPAKTKQPKPTQADKSAQEKQQSKKDRLNSEKANAQETKVTERQTGSLADTQMEGLSSIAQPDQTERNQTKRAKNPKKQKPEKSSSVVDKSPSPQGEKELKGTSSSSSEPELPSKEGNKTSVPKTSPIKKTKRKEANTKEAKPPKTPKAPKARKTAKAKSGTKPLAEPKSETMPVERLKTQGLSQDPDAKTPERIQSEITESSQPKPSRKEKPKSPRATRKANKPDKTAIPEGQAAEAKKMSGSKPSESSAVQPQRLPEGEASSATQSSPKAVVKPEPSKQEEKRRKEKNTRKAKPEQKKAGEAQPKDVGTEEIRPEKSTRAKVTSSKPALSKAAPEANALIRDAAPPQGQPLQTEPKPVAPSASQDEKGLITVEVSPPETASQATLVKSSPVTPSPTMPAEVTQLAAQYLTVLQQWQQSKQKESLEPVLNKGQEAARAILQRAETLTDEDFEAIKKSMPGYLILHRDILVAGPDPAFFLTLATQKGKPADQAFFKLMNQTLNGYWPSTMEQLDDLSGCTRFGSGELLRLYGEWTTFKRQFPNAYAKALQDPNLLLLSDLEDQLVNSNAACEGPDSVQQELQRFVENFPKSPLTPKIRQRLLDLQQKKLDMSFNQGVRHRLKDDTGE